MVNDFDAMAEAAHDLFPVPVQRLLQFCLPGAVVVMQQRRLISISSVRMLNLKRAWHAVGLHGIQFSLQWQQRLALVLIEAEMIGFCSFGQIECLFVRREIRLPVAGFSFGRCDGFEWVDKRNSFTREQTAEGAGQRWRRPPQMSPPEPPFRRTSSDARTLLFSALQPVHYAFEGFVE